MNYELDMTVDEQSWVKENPVYCPAPWCAAHNNRHLRCGDDDGDYEGIHVARIEYAKGQAARDRRAVARRKKAGFPDPELALGISKLIQDGIDRGDLTGKKFKKGRREL